MLPWRRRALAGRHQPGSHQYSAAIIKAMSNSTKRAVSTQPFLFSRALDFLFIGPYARGLRLTWRPVLVVGNEKSVRLPDSFTHIQEALECLCK